VTSLDLTKAIESPSLVVPGVGPSFEMKFLLAEDEAAEVERWASQRLDLDPHGDPALGGAYRTTSLYFDTANLDVYHRTPWYRRHKFRLRRYGLALGTFAERKSKWGDRVAKKRALLAEPELTLLAQEALDPTWPGHWFHRRLVARGLGPACRIAYERVAFIGASVEGPLRLTLDRQVRGRPTSEWGVGPFEGGLPLLFGKVILELKFRSALPSAFKELVADLRLVPTGVSKYRLCREAWGVPAAGREAVNA